MASSESVSAPKYAGESAEIAGAHLHPIRQCSVLEVVIAHHSAKIDEGFNQRDIDTLACAAYAQNASVIDFPDELPAECFGSRSSAFEYGLALVGADQHARVTERA